MTAAPAIRARCALDLPGFCLRADLTLPAHGISAVFGPSGCGKTTLLRCIAGLERPRGDSRIEVGGEAWLDVAGAIDLPPHRRRLGMVFQDAALFEHLGVRGNLEYGWRRVAPEARRVAFDDAVSLLGLGALLDRRPGRLSGGERQRVAIARALLASPALLLMDEPLAALDQSARGEILPFLERLHEELSIPVIYVSHAPEEVARLADHLVLMEAGGIRASGPAADLLARLDLPLAHGDDAAVIIECRVAGHDDEHRLTWLDFPGGRVEVARRDYPVGRAARVRIQARDVSLTLSRQTDTSILNIWPATVVELAEEGTAQLMARLDAGGTPLLARVTRKSGAVLGLAPGRPVFAQVKSVALLD